MVEIAIALGVIGFALVAIIGILPAGMSVQKDNREETLINFDAAYLLNAIRSGAQGQDNLTNYIVAITNYSTLCNSNGVPGAIITTNWFTNANGGVSGAFSINGGAVQTSNFLTNGANIMGLLSIPKYIFADTKGNYFSNYTTADFRAITGNAVDQGTNAASQEFAFKYRLVCELIPTASYAYASGDTNWVNFTAPGLATNAAAGNFLVATNLQNNLNHIRLRFRWPILPSGGLANGRQVFRGSASGTYANVPVTTPGGGFTLYYVQPGVL